MTEPRDPQSQPPSPGKAASDTDLAASELLEDWLVGSPHSDRTPNHGAPAGRAGAMLNARNALRSHEDAASSGELDRLLEGALEQLDDGSSPLGEGRPSGNGHTGRVRHLDVRRPWIAAAAAAIVGIVGVGTLVVQGSDLEESAQDAGDSSVATQSSDAGAAEADAAPGVVTTSVAPESAEQPLAPGQRTEESPTAEPGEFTEPDGSAGSDEAGGDAMDTSGDTGTPGSIFAGVHATGRIQLP